MLNPIHLRTLIEVTRLGSFAAAANRLGYTPSAVSQQMAALEQDSGVKLFDRTARSARSTPAADIMAQHAVTVLAEFDALLEAAAAAGSGGEAELRVSVYASLAQRVLPDLLTARSADGEPIALRLSIRDPSPAIRALRSGEEVDVSLVYRVGASGLSWPDAVRAELLGEDHYRVVVPDAWDLHGRGEVDAAQLAGRPWVLHHQGSSDIAEIEAVFAARNLRPRIVARCDEFPISLQLVRSGFAASFMPQVALDRVPDGVRVLDVPQLALSRRVWALVSRNAPEQATRTLLRRLRESIGRDSRG